MADIVGQQKYVELQPTTNSKRNKQYSLLCHWTDNIVEKSEWLLSVTCVLFAEN